MKLCYNLVALFLSLTHSPTHSLVLSMSVARVFSGVEYVEKEPLFCPESLEGSFFLASDTVFYWLSAESAGTEVEVAAATLWVVCRRWRKNGKQRGGRGNGRTDDGQAEMLHNFVLLLVVNLRWTRAGGE